MFLLVYFLELIYDTNGTWLFSREHGSKNDNAKNNYKIN